MSVSGYISKIKYADLTGDLNGDAVMEPDATLALLPRGFWATRGILNPFVIIVNGSFRCRIR